MGWFSKSEKFEKQVESELAVLYRVARRMGARREEAEDLVQMTMVKAYKAWDSFDGKHLRSWLIRILRNEWLMSLRSANAAESLDEMEGEAADTDSLWQEVSFRMDVSRILEELELLPESFKLAIQLCDVEQMSYEEAAEALEIPIGTVRSRLSRGRTMLREKLVPFEGNFGGVLV